MEPYSIYKKQCLGFDFSDSELLLQSGLVSDFENISRQIMSVLVLTNWYDTPFHERLLILKKDNDKDAFLMFFEDSRSIMEQVWNSADFASIISSLIRHSIKAMFESGKTIAQEHLYFPPDDIPFGSIGARLDLRSGFTYKENVDSLDAFRTLLIQSVVQTTSGNDDYLNSKGLSLSLLEDRKKQFMDVIIQGVDMVAKVGHISNVTERGCFFFPINPYAFTDQLAVKLYGKSFNIKDQAYEGIEDGKFADSLGAVQQAFQKVVQEGYWNQVLPGTDLAGIMRMIIGSCDISAKSLGEKYIIPVEVNVPGGDGIKKLVYSGLDLLHFLSLISKVSSSPTLTMKLNTETGEMMIQADTTINDFENKPASPFIYLKPYDVSDTKTLDSFKTIDLRELSVTESIRERERLSRKIHNYDQAISRIWESVKPAAPVVATAVEEEVVNEIEAADFYTGFLNKCTSYVESYTKIINVVDKNGKENGEKVRMPDLINQKDFDYVYSSREAFWYDNINFPIPDLIAFFLSKGNNSNYRKLSKEILGSDCYEFEDELVDELIKGGNLCVQELRIDYKSKQVEKLVYAYASDYVKGDYYSKYARLDGEGKSGFTKDIVNYFGADSGLEIIQRQQNMLVQEKNKPMTLLIENPELLSDQMNQLELGADNEILWTSPELIDLYTWNSYKDTNPRTDFISKSSVLRKFHEWAHQNSSNPAMQEFRNGVEEFFDACIVPMVNSEYIAKYVLPNWVVKEKDADGIDITVPSPIELPEFEYNLTVTKKGQKKKVGTKRRLKFVKSQLYAWNGNKDYVKNMDPSLGEMEKYKWVGIETDLDTFVYNKTPEGIAAKKAWEKTMDNLIKASIDTYNKRKSVATRVCNIVFNMFLREHISPEMREKIEKAWNNKYNGYVLPKFQKYPLFIKHARYFGKNTEPFQFMDAQTGGMKNFISRDNSLIMGHEVGFGKTTSAIGGIAHLFETGEGSRVLLSVPNIVYAKWKKEIKGDENYRGLLPGANVVDLYNATSSALKALKTFTPDEEDALVKFELFAKDFQIFLKKVQDRTLDMDKHDYNTVMNLLVKRIPSYALFKSLEDFENEMRYSFDYVKNKFEGEVDKTEKIFNTRASKTNSKVDQNKLDKAILLLKMEYDRILTRKISGAITFRQNSLVDDLGQYKPEVLRPESIIICTHEAISRLRGDLLGGLEAFAIIDDAFDEVPQELKDIDTYGLSRTQIVQILDQWREGESINLKQAVLQAKSIGSSATRKNERINVFCLPVSLRKLNVDAFMVDEIHEFNNIVSQAKKRAITAIDIASGAEGPPLRFYKMTGVGSSGKNKAVLEYNTQNTGSRKIASVNCLAIARSIQNKNKMEGKNNNTLLLSATPFVDSPLFQMISVFSIMNYELMLNAGISGVFDVFNQFACEEWKLDISHDKKIGCFPTVDRYKNIYANSNLLRLFVNFKISDSQIEGLRPVKYIFPDKLGSMKALVGGTEEVNTYVTMNKFQEEAKEKIVKFLHGEIEYEDLYPFEAKYGTDNEQEEVADLEVDKEEDLTNLKNIDVGQIVFVNANKVYWQLDSSDIENIQSWTLLGSNKKVVIQQTDIEEDDEKIDESEHDTLQTLKKGNFGKKDMATARTIVGMGADEKLSLSPYISRIVAGLPPLTEYDPQTKKKKLNVNNFVENSPKLLFTAEAIKSVIDYQKAHNQPLCGQIVYIDRFKFKYDDDTWYFPLEMFKQYLVDRADIDLKAEDICIITGSISTLQRQSFAADFNEGKYKILIGTSAIKQGVDLQVNTALMYILQADYVPSTIMQVEGRGWRQGNLWQNIRICYVLSYGTLDNFQLSKVDRKIGQIKKMLEGRVFDLNTTQFDKDFDGMKLELEPFLPKRAELKYEIERVAFENEFNKYNSQLNAFVKIQKNINTYIPYWEGFIERLNLIGEGLQKIAVEDIRDEYIKILRNQLQSENSKKLKQIISTEQERMIEENKQFEKGTLEQIKLEKEILSKMPKPESKPVGPGVEVGVIAEGVPVTEPVVVSSAEKEAFEAQVKKIDNLEKLAEKPLRNKQERDAVMEPVVEAARAEMEKAVEAISVTEEEAIAWATANPNALEKPKEEGLVRWTDLFTQNESGDTNRQINYIHQPVEVNTQYSTIMAVVNKISSKIRVPLSSNIYTNLTDYKKKDYQRYFDLMESVGYKVKMDLRTLGITDFLRLNESLWEIWVQDKSQWEHTTEKGQIIRDFYTQIKEISRLDDMVEHARKFADQAYAKMNNKPSEVKRILKELQEDEELKVDAGLYDMTRQVERFSKTNALLIRK